MLCFAWVVLLCFIAKWVRCEEKQGNPWEIKCFIFNIFLKKRRKKTFKKAGGSGGPGWCPDMALNWLAGQWESMDAWARELIDLGLVMDAWARGLAGKPIGHGKDGADRPITSRPCLTSHRGPSEPSSLFELLKFLIFSNFWNSKHCFSQGFLCFSYISTH